MIVKNLAVLSQTLTILTLVGLSAACSPTTALNTAQDGTRCADVTASVNDAGFGEKVSVDCADGKAVIHSNSYPDHILMTGIVGTNEQVPVPAEGLSLIHI